MYLSLASKVPRDKMEQFSFQILDYILKKIGKEGSLIIPVFDEDSVKENFLTEKKYGTDWNIWKLSFKKI